MAGIGSARTRTWLKRKETQLTCAIALVVDAPENVQVCSRVAVAPGEARGQNGWIASEAQRECPSFRNGAALHDKACSGLLR